MAYILENKEFEERETLSEIKNEKVSAEAESEYSLETKRSRKCGPEIKKRKAAEPEYELVEIKKSRKSGHEKKHNFCIQKSIFKSIIKELSNNRSFSEEAIQILHETSEDYIIKLFEKSNMILDTVSRRTVLDTDIRLINEIYMSK